MLVQVVRLGQDAGRQRPLPRCAARTAVLVRDELRGLADQGERAQQVGHTVMMPDRRGVIVPPELCRTVARLAVLGLADRVRRDGGSSVPPGLAALLAELDKSAGGPGFATVEAPSWLAAGEAAHLTGTSARHVRRLARSGRLRARKRGRDWEIEQASAADYGRERRCRTP